MRSVGLADRVRVLSPTEADAEAPIVGIVLANEVADALPVHRLVWRDGALRECWVTATSAGFSEVEAELSAEARAFGLDQRLAAAGIVPTTGDRFEISPAAAMWFAGVARRIARGYTLIIDYGYRTAELYRDHRLAGTLRAYHRHTVDDDPFRRIGRQDLTAHVDFGALIAAGESVGLRLAGFTSQGEFLAGLGLGELIVGLQRDPALTAADYLATQAAMLRLIDPGGMGRFGVLMMARDAPVDPPLRGFRERGPLF
jgi:SAM-dependent MidA family methyltransferase